MASFPCITIPILLAMTVFLVFKAPLSLSSTADSELGISTISAAPAALPDVPATAPTTYLAPDIMPLLPHTRATAPSPSGSGSNREGDPETIPASPSPPNPDELAPAGFNSAVSPSGSFGAMASTSSVSAPTALPACTSPAFVALLLSSFLFFFFQLTASN